MKRSTTHNGERSNEYLRDFGVSPQQESTEKLKAKKAFLEGLVRQLPPDEEMTGSVLVFEALGYHNETIVIVAGAFRTFENAWDIHKKTGIGFRLSVQIHGGKGGNYRLSEIGSFDASGYHQYMTASSKGAPDA